MSIINQIIDALRPYWLPWMLVWLAFLGCVWWAISKANERD